MQDKLTKKLDNITSARNQRIIEAMKARGVTREAVSKLLGVTPSAVTQKLNDKRVIDSIDFVYAVAKLTGYSPHFLIYGEEDDQPVKASDTEPQSLANDPVATYKNEKEVMKELIESQRETILLQREEIKRLKSEKG